MKIIAALLTMLAILLAGCARGQLTKSKAQSALNHWALTARVNTSGASAPMSWSDKPMDDLSVSGVQETPQENSARADVRFNSFRYGRGNADSYTGNGVATFSHYNDGRWALTKVEIPGREWSNLSVEP